MNIQYTERALAALADAPEAVQKSLFKQVRFLADNLNHPSLHAKKYDTVNDVWQARVNRDWRFYFLIVGDTYIITSIIPHPK